MGERLVSWGRRRGGAPTEGDGGGVFSRIQHTFANRLAVRAAIWDAEKWFGSPHHAAPGRKFFPRKQRRGAMHTPESFHSVVSLDAEFLASASSDKTVRVWHAASGVCVRVLEGHTGEVHCVAAVCAGRLESASSDKTVRMWDVIGGACLRVL